MAKSPKKPVGFDIKVGEFQANHKKLKRMVKRHDFDSEATSIQLSKTLLAMVIELLPMSESAFRKSKGQKGIYAINSLLNSARELSHDLRAMSDRSDLSEKAMKDCINPNMRTIAQAISNEMSILHREVYSKSPDKVRRRLLPQIDKSKEELLNRLLVVNEAIEGGLTNLLEV